MVSSRLGESLKAARARAGWSREALAYHSGVSWSAIAQIESGRRNDVRLSSLSALAEALGVWQFPDERPLKAAEVLAAVRERGEVLLVKTLWPLILTQTLIVVRKHSAPPISGVRVTLAQSSA